MLVFSGINVGAQLVGSGPEGFADVFDHGVYRLLPATTRVGVGLFDWEGLYDANVFYFRPNLLSPGYF